MALESPISKQEYLEWKGNRVTKEYLKGLFDTREELKEDLAEVRNSTNEDRLIVAGRCQALKDAIDYAIFNFNYEGKNTDEVESGSA